LTRRRESGLGIARKIFGGSIVPLLHPIGRPVLTDAFDVRAAIGARLAAEVLEGLSDRLSEKIGDLRDASPGSGIAMEQVSEEIRGRAADRLATLTPEQRAAIRSIVRERLPDELREKLADRLAERLDMLTPEQREAVRAAIRERLAIEVREGLSDRVADRLPAIEREGGRETAGKTPPTAA
jgi:hypothetical protein